jgi:prepilin-type processing-associated H-X9-DG protein
MMQGEPPSTHSMQNEDYHREYVMAKEYSWRHAGKQGINAGFFDGHVELMKVNMRGKPNGPWTGNAVRPQWYYPTGSIVNDPNELHDKSIPAGTKLP